MNSKTMRIFALDQALKTGWASQDERGGVECGTLVFEADRGESKGIRYLKFRNWLNKMMDQIKPEVVVYEQTHQRGGYATEVAYAFTTRIQELCAERRIPYKAVHSGTLKKSATGSGKASKPEMIIKAKARFPSLLEVIGDDDDIADALHLLNYALKEYE